MVNPIAGVDKLTALKFDHENFHETASAEVAYVKAVLSAIESLAPIPTQQKTVIELAKLGQWVADNVENSIDCFGDQVTRVCREVR